MKKRMKMKKYAEGGMSDDDEGYDAYTTSVTDDEGEVLYKKPEAKTKAAKPSRKVNKPVRLSKDWYENNKLDKETVAAVRADEANERAKRVAKGSAARFGDTGKPEAFTIDDRRERARGLSRAPKRVERASGDAAGEFSYRKGGSVKSSASRRADGIAQRGKTRGRLM